MDGRDSTSIAQTDCSLLVLTKIQYLKLAKKFVKVKRQMVNMATQRRNHFKKAIEECKESLESEFDIDSQGMTLNNFQ